MAAPPAPPSSSSSPPPSLLLALPDHLLRRLLLRNLHPSPDLFAVALACRRLRGVLSAPGSYLVVTFPPASRPASAAAAAAAAAVGQGAYPDLASAVAASRPGDTVWLSPTPSPGPPHVVERAVRVRHPLNIVGGGRAPRDTRVECASPSAAAVLDFSAPRARVANVTLVHRGPGGCGGAAVLHRSGRLRVERCRLKGARHALPGLSAPLVTVAAAAVDGEEGGQDLGEEEEEEGWGDEGDAAAVPGAAPKAIAAAAAAAAGPAAAAAGGGLLEVSETELGATDRRGGQGVRALGTGEVRAVRAVFGGGGAGRRAGGTLEQGDGGGFDGTVYWLEVDAARPGRRAPGAAAAAASLLLAGGAGRRAGGGELARAPAPPGPPPPPPHPLAPKAWRGQGPDDALLRINALLGKRARGSVGGTGAAAMAAAAEEQERRRQR